MTKPTLVIVPGSFMPANFYSRVVDGLRARNFETTVYDLPSASRKPPEQAATLAEDAVFFNGVLSAMTDMGKDVVVMAHSYGGSVGCECVKGLTKKRDGKGRVVGLIFLSAIVPKVGENIGAMTSKLGFDFVRPDGDFLYQDPFEKSARTNFSDLPMDQALGCVKQLQPHSAIAMGGESQYDGYKDVDSVAYITCLNDKCLPPDFQKEMMDNARSGGKPVKVYEIESGHCPNVSIPEELVRVCEEILNAQFS